METKEIVGRRVSYALDEEGNYQTVDNYDVTRCLTVSPLGDAKFVDCGESANDFADTLCRFSIEN